MIRTYEVHDKMFGLIDTVEAYGYRHEGEQILFFDEPVVLKDRKVPGRILRVFSRKQTVIKEVKNQES